MTVDALDTDRMLFPKLPDRRELLFDPPENIDAFVLPTMFDGTPGGRPYAAVAFGFGWFRGWIDG